MEKNRPCADKLVFETKQEAQAVATMEKYRSGVKLKTYICKDCGLWHLTSDWGQ